MIQRRVCSSIRYVKQGTMAPPRGHHQLNGIAGLLHQPMLRSTIEP